MQIMRQFLYFAINKKKSLVNGRKIKSLQLVDFDCVKTIFRDRFLYLADGWPLFRAKIWFERPSSSSKETTQRDSGDLTKRTDRGPISKVAPEAVRVVCIQPPHFSLFLGFFQFSKFPNTVKTRYNIVWKLRIWRSFLRIWLVWQDSW